MLDKKSCLARELIMTILMTWYHLITRMKPDFIMKLASVWWKNSIELCKTMIKKWWPLLIVLLAAYSGYLRIFLNLIMTGKGLAHLLMVRFATGILASIILGMWLSILVIMTHPSIFPKAKDYYRSHLLYFLCATALVAGTYLYFIALPIGFFPTSTSCPEPKYCALAQLYIIFSSFFVLDAHHSISEYLRALTILPIKLLIFNLPITVLLYLLLITINWAPTALSILLLTPLFIVLCGIVYKLTINSNYADYYPNN